MSDTEELLALVKDSLDSGDPLYMTAITREVIERMADALEAVTAERDSLAAVIAEAHSGVRQVVSKIDSFSWDNRSDVFVRSTRESALAAFEVLSQDAPAASLADRDARVLREIADTYEDRAAWAENNFLNGPSTDYAIRHYRETAADLLEYAAEITEDARIREEGSRS